MGTGWVPDHKYGYGYGYQVMGTDRGTSAETCTRVWGEYGYGCGFYNTPEQ